MHKKLLGIMFIILFGTITANAQDAAQMQKYRSDPYGNRQYRKEGIMDGNQVRTLYYNNGEVGQWPFSPSLEWPKGSGHNYCDGVCMLAVAEVKTPGGAIIHSLETSYREQNDKDPVTGLIWGLEPLPGYANSGSETPAISTDPATWPKEWPKVLPGIDAKWDGYWYGYFGRGVKNSDFETFYAMDDSKDGEFARSPYYYFPVASDSNRKGIGIRVEVRGFQWSHVLAEDIIFWHYDIVNMADLGYDKVCFGFYTDTGIGGANDNGDDCASYDTKLDIAYAYDFDGIAPPGSWKTGYFGYAYLESPGNASNGIDDDEDGMIDEKRDDGIDNDHDWQAFTDLDGNGKWDKSEPLNNDVGKDGVGPYDLQYAGPDEGEGDGLPTSGEPSFDKTDKDESDQIGLTSLSIYRLGSYGTGGGWPKDDESMWLKMNYNSFDTSLQKANISITFASGPLPLVQYGRERFSMALLYGSDKTDLFFNKETVQEIYNANYNFAKPPLKPTLKAVAGDKKVYLYWDNIAEESRDPFLGYQNNDPKLGYKKDFEGYLIYRSLEPEFNDIKTITDCTGEAKYWKPIAQFDLLDDISGADPVGINGACFNRGKNSGLKHTYIDEDVINGKKYYYALVSYDMGDPKYGTKGLVPSECTKIISVDYSNNIKFVDYNCAVVTPDAKAAGYTAPEVKGDLTKVASGNGTGSIKVQVVDPTSIKNDVSYDVKFKISGTYPAYKTSSAYIIRTSAGGTSDTLLTNFASKDFEAGNTSKAYDGMILSVNNDSLVTVVDSLTGWQKGQSNLDMYTRQDSTAGKCLAWPSDYEIRFYGEKKAVSPYNKIPLNFLVINTSRQDTVYAEVIDNDKSKSLTIGDEIIVLEKAGNTYKFTWKLNYHNPIVGQSMAREPAAGDVYVVKTYKPFNTDDSFTYSTKSEYISNEKSKTELDKISVVPNPYICAASWEVRNLGQSGRGERRIDFINLPASCTIRVYDISGSLVKTLYKESSDKNGALSWNLVTEDGMNLAYGLYVYHVDAPGIGTKIGKFAIIK